MLNIDLSKFHRMPIEITTETDAMEFMNIANQFNSPIYIENGDGDLRINAKSILGLKVAYIEWSDLYCLYTDEKVSTAIYKFSKKG